MSGTTGTKVITAKGSIWHDLTNRVKLVVRLLRDRRVNPLLKLLPIGSLIYLIFPDLLPGPIDDAIVLWLGTFLFVELCPAEVVQEHLEAINRVIQGEWHDPLHNDEEIIDAEFREEH
jgi:hypothetical protein